MSYGYHGDSQHSPHQDPSIQGTNGMPLRAATAPMNRQYNAKSDDNANSHKHAPPLRSGSHDQSTKGYQQVSPTPGASNFPNQAHYLIRPQDISQHFNRRRQTLYLFLTAGLRFLVTMLFIAMFVVALRSCK